MSRAILRWTKEIRTKEKLFPGFSVLAEHQEKNFKLKEMLLSERQRNCREAWSVNNKPEAVVANVLHRK